MCHRSLAFSGVPNPERINATRGGTVTLPELGTVLRYAHCVQGSAFWDGNRFDVVVGDGYFICGTGLGRGAAPEGIAEFVSGVPPSVTGGTIPSFADCPSSLLGDFFDSRSGRLFGTV